MSGYKPELAEELLTLLEQKCDDEADAAIHLAAGLVALVVEPDRAHKLVDYIYAQAERHLDDFCETCGASFPRDQLSAVGLRCKGCDPTGIETEGSAA